MTAAERRTLAPLAETFVPACDPERVATLAEEALLRAADPAQVAQLRLVLRLLEVGPANGLTGAPWRPFGAMAHAEREALLLRWGMSRLGLRRAAASSGGAWLAFEARLAAMDFAPNRGGLFSAHQMGTIRMGADSATHPADPRGRVRRDSRGRLIEGLYVADGSTFPTGIGVNPMIGIMAMARRVSRTVLAEARTR